MRCALLLCIVLPALAARQPRGAPARSATSAAARKESSGGPKMLPEAARKELVRVGRLRAGVYKDRREPSFKDIVLLTIATWGFRDFYFNWRCWAKKAGLDFLTLALDKQILTHVGKDSAALIADYESKAMHYDDLSYNELCCRKLSAVLDLMRGGLSVIQTDADNVMVRDPFRLINDAVVAQYDWMYQANMPGCRRRTVNPNPLCHWVCGGFYYSSARKASLRALFQKGLDVCWDITGEANGNDQRALQNVFDKLRRGQLSHPGAPKKARWCRGMQHPPPALAGDDTLEYCIMDPRQAPIGARGHWHGNQTAANILTFHANWVQGSKLKRKLLERRGLWQPDAKC
eukprot:TRINITY_DN924_c0_g2_i1.p1 TRINITY_DN924_c0_g2~~TRINITY_DN924_c0_g2_i1.p1  ORF type:complete len:367 (+),score=132.74 TRINITY_DN924_c0_g2_i1:66-1103(+)